MSEIAALIHTDFNHMLSKMHPENQICMHVRRGDYATNPLTLKYHGLQGVDYYEQAMKYFSNKYQNPEFHIFTDSLEMVAQEFQGLKDYKLIFHPPKSSTGDMIEMAKFQNIVIANSSYSWWAAFLKPIGIKDKGVIYPQRWFTELESPPLFPENWKAI
jgi:hypothetical protein